MLVIMKLCCCKWFIVICILLFSTLVSAKNHDNCRTKLLDILVIPQTPANLWEECGDLFIYLQGPLKKLKCGGSENAANEFVNIINENRTAQKLQKLNNNPGLGCIALQYMEECNGTCTSNGTMKCQTPEDDFTEVYAPNCGVELPTFGILSGRIVGCQSKYLKPSEAFSQIIGRDQKTLSLVKDKKHTEIGVGLVRSHQGPFLWCVLLSNDKVNSTFVLEGGGKGIKQKRGCFSGTNTPCSRGEKIHLLLYNILTVICSIFVLFISGIVHL